ncbi:MAG TPA: aspartate-semialdehyde dehydrogenase [Armatimonadota bacterium]|nr:aspartate-semialdehyde dehydrogenase [Armatimonadota bacterium]
MGLRVGVVGVGPVGDRIIRCIRERDFPVEGAIVVMATREREEELGGEKFLVCECDEGLFQGLDVVFFAGREGAKGASVQWGCVATDAGAWVIDNGGDFRMDPRYPLVVPEVNMDAVTGDCRHICSPNCSTIQMVVAIAPIHRAVGIRRIVVSTYQATSGWGQAAMEEFENQVIQYAAGEPVGFDPAIFTRPIIFDCLPHIDRFLDTGYTKEELKMVNETRKIMGEPEMRITSTAVRVPVVIGHAESINLELEAPLSREEALAILRDPDQSPGVVVIDGPSEDPSAIAVRSAPEELGYPTQADVLRDEYKDAVLVGRVREDPSVEHGLNLWCVADNLRKGAATNTVQIAEALIQRGLL